MLKKFKSWFISLFVGIFYKKELKAVENMLKKAQRESKERALKEISDQFATLTPEQRALADKCKDLQNELLKLFIKFSQEIRDSEGTDMDGIAGVWMVSMSTITQALQAAFAKKDDKLIKEHLYALEQELEIAIVTSDQVLTEQSAGLPTQGKVPYNGPKGEA